MPFGDRTGPAGLGPMTGRAAGYCAGFGVPGYMNPIPGWGRGFWGGGRGRGHRWRHWFYLTGLPFWARAWWWGPAPGFFPTWPGAPSQSDPKAEEAALRQQAKVLEAELEAIKKRLSELEQQAGAPGQ